MTYYCAQEDKLECRGIARLRWSIKPNTICHQGGIQILKIDKARMFNCYIYSIQNLLTFRRTSVSTRTLQDCDTRPNGMISNEKLTNIEK